MYVGFRPSILRLTEVDVFGHQPFVALKASSSTGRAAVSKTAGWGFDSLLACQLSPTGGQRNTSVRLIY